MAISEFELIDHFFNKAIKNTQINRLGIGDDCALMSIPDGFELAMTMDTMVEGVHFFPDCDPFDLGHKLLAVNLSDLAAMGANPIAVSLAITIPDVDENWMSRFASGFFQLADHFNIDLIGGDTTQGHLTLSVQAMGLVPEGQAIKRSTAQIGDEIFVTGYLGEAALGLKIKNGYQCASPEPVLAQFNRPMPRIKQGAVIQDIASSCIDLSDGIASDLGHILNKSGVGAQLIWDHIPMSRQVKTYIADTGDWRLPLCGGEDYELCFTVSSRKRHLISIPCFQIGVIEQKPGLRLNRFGKIENMMSKGYEHFS